MSSMILTSSTCSGMRFRNVQYPAGGSVGVLKKSDRHAEFSNAQRSRPSGSARLEIPPQRGRHRLHDVGHVRLDLRRRHVTEDDRDNRRMHHLELQRGALDRRSGVPWVAQIASIFRTRSMISDGGAAYSNLAPGAAPVARMPELIPPPARRPSSSRAPGSEIRSGRPE